MFGAHVPIPKLGKDTSTLEGFTFISLLTLLLELIDKVLQWIIEPLIKRVHVVSPWQTGGAHRANDAAWVLFGRVPQ